MSEREILFRGKRIDNGKWVEGCLLIDYVSGQYFIHASGNSVNESDKVNEEGCLKFFAFEVDHETICRYTGLTDKNGRKIFESDIVKDTSLHTIGKVYYWEYEGRFAFDDVNDGAQFYTGEMWEDCEVIGNIFDNSELLN